MLRLIKGIHLLFVTALTFREQLWGRLRVQRLHLIADDRQQGKMKPRHWHHFVSLGFALLLYGASPALAQTLLGTAQSFGVLGGQAVTNTGPTVITGDLGAFRGRYLKRGKKVGK